jgi:hypothetical protein
MIPHFSSFGRLSERTTIMAIETDAEKQWQRIAAQLLADRESHRQAWGEIDDELIACYIADTCSASERRQVEGAMQTHADLRSAIELVQAVLSSGPVWKLTGNASPLIERLQVWVDVAGRVIATGLQSLMQERQPTYGGALDTSFLVGEGSVEQVWEVPVSDAGYSLTLAMRAAKTPGEWELRCKLHSDGEPGMAQRARLALHQSGEVPTATGAVSDFEDQPLRLSAGVWELTIVIDKDVRVIPIELGGAT